MPERINVGVIGTGLMGAVHARILARRIKGAELAAVADADPDRAGALAAELGGITVHPNGLALIADPNVAAVVIASPSDTHREFVLACLAWGKPVMCEKPLEETAADGLAIVEAEVRTGRRQVQVGFMREFDPEHTAVRAAIDAGEIGEPVLFRGIHISPTFGGMIASPEFVVTSSIIHEIHAARSFLRQEFDTVFVTSVPRVPGRADTCRLLTISATFTNGSVGLMDVNVEATYGYAVSAEVVGTEGTVSTNRPRRATLFREFASHQEVARGYAERFAEAYHLELEAWLESTRTGMPVGPSAWDGYVALVVADACRRSLATGAAVKVERPTPPGLYARI